MRVILIHINYQNGRGRNECALMGFISRRWQFFACLFFLLLKLQGTQLFLLCLSYLMLTTPSLPLQFSGNFQGILQLLNLLQTFGTTLLSSLSRITEIIRPVKCHVLGYFTKIDYGKELEKLFSFTNFERK